MAADVTPVTNAAVTYGDARASDQKAADQTTINSLQSQVSTLQTQNAAQAAQIADLQAQLAAKPSSPKVRIGARNHDLNFQTINNQIGPLTATRVFWQGFPAKAGPVQDQTVASGAQNYPASVQLWVSVKSDTNLEAWCRSVTDPTQWVIVLNHEPENGDFASGAAFKSWFIGMRDRIKAVNPNLKVCHAAAGSTYASGHPGYDGSYIIPADKVDVCTIDIYRPSLNLMKPLTKDVRFQRWYSFVKSRPAIGITEWGIGLPADDPTLAPLRPDIIKADRAYFKTLPNFVTAQYWYTLGLDGKNYRPTDAASISLLKDMAVNGP